MESYKCPVCGNTDIHSIGMLNGKPYCRRCISFKGEEVEHKPSYPKKAPIHLEYELSPEQKELSDKLVENYKKGIDSLVFAVCGSGKTEIVINLISQTIKEGLKVAFAVPRRDVAIELYCRFKSIFTENNLALVYGGHTNRLEGDLVCMTTHQLFRYEKYFDLIIMDEMDAFPYKGSEVLEAFFKRALRGHYVLLSATPDKDFVTNFKKKGGMVLELNIRFHRHPLPVPEVILTPKIMMPIKISKILKEMIRENKPVFIFAPTIDRCELLFNLLKFIVKGGNYVHSKHPYRSKVISDFREGKYKYLITTAVLERGVTVKDLQVIIFNADHEIYDSYSLVQISGRVGRKKEAPEGRVIYVAERLTDEMEKSINDIKRANKSLQNML